MGRVDQIGCDVALSMTLNFRRSVGWAISLALGVGAIVAAEPTPVNVRTAPGRFEIAAIDASQAHVIATAAEEAWRVLAGPLVLPDSFPTPIFVRVQPPDTAVDPLPFRVVVEPGGVVSVWISPRPEAESATTRRALVQGLLMRLAVARHGVNERLSAPLWLEHACVGWWQTRAGAAQLDALKHEAASLPVPTLAALLSWQRGGAEPRDFVTGAVWLLTFLQAESGRGREWPNLLPRLLGGEEPLAALNATYPGRFADAGERELWWATGCHHAQRARSLPALDSAESRIQLEGLTRFVFAGPTEDADRVVPVREVLARGTEAIVAPELARRLAELERLIPALHPFYRNAGLALAEALRAGPGNRGGREVLCAAWERDWGDATELEAAAKAALDRMEGKAAAP